MRVHGDSYAEDEVRGALKDAPLQVQVIRGHSSWGVCGANQEAGLRSALKSAEALVKRGVERASLLGVACQAIQRVRMPQAAVAARSMLTLLEKMARGVAPVRPKQQQGVCGGGSVSAPS